MEHPKAIGDRTTLAVMAALHELGMPLYVPFGENTRCDLVAEIGGRLTRVQCKTGRIRDGAIVFKTVSSYAHHRNPKMRWRHYLDEVDVFAVHCSATAGVYLVPIDDLPTGSSASLRVEPARNNQVRRVRQAGDYEIGRVAIERLRAPSGAR